MALNGSEDVTVGFGASVDGLARGMLDAVRSVQSGTTQMSSALGNVTAAGSKFLGVFATIAATLAGGRIFGQAVTETVRFGTEVGQLSRRFQISATEASAFAVAIDDAFLTVDQFNQVATSLTRQLRSDEDAFKALGVQTRDLKGNLVDQKTLFTNTLNTLREYEGGTNQLLAAQKLLGRGITEDVLQKLFEVQENMVTAGEASREMGQVMGVENVAAAKEFRRAQDNAGDAVQGMQIAIGNALIPTFSQLLGIFSKAAAQFIPVLSAAFKGLSVVVLGVTEIVYGLFQVFKGLVETVTVAVVGLFSVMSSLARGDFGEAKARWAAIGNSIAQSWEDVGKRIDEQTKKSRAAMALVLTGGGDGVFNEGTNRSGTKKYKDKDKEDKESKERLDALKRELAMLKQAQGDYNELSKQQEADFWQAKIALFARGSKEWQEVNTLYLAARRAAAQEAVEIQRFELQEQLAAAGNDATEKLRLAEAWLARMRTLYGEDSKQYRDALKDKNAADRTFADQQRQFADMQAASMAQARQAELDIAREEGQVLVELGRRSREQQVDAEREYLAKTHELQAAEIERKRALYADDVVMQQQLNAERARLDVEFNRELARNSMEQRRTIFGAWTDMVDGMFSTLKTVTQGLLQRTMTWRQATQQLMSSLLSSFLELGVRRLRDWVITELMMSAATKAGTVTRAAAQVAGSATVTAVKAGEATAVVGANAAEAATGAAASQAAIPVVGPALAMAAAAAMLAFVLGLGGQGGGSSSQAPSLPSAAGGWWDIPRDTLAFVHQREMVMPAHLADGVRTMVEGGGGLGGSFAPSMTIQAVDAAGVERLFMRHSDKLMGAMLEAYKNHPRTRR